MTTQQQREAFEDFVWRSTGNKYVNKTMDEWEDIGRKTAFDAGWQAAQAQQGEGEPVAWLVKYIGEIPRLELAEPGEISQNPKWWTNAFPVYTHPQPAQQVPEGWKIEKHPEGISIYLPSNRGGIHLTDGPHNSIAHDVLRELCAALLTTQEDK